MAVKRIVLGGMVATMIVASSSRVAVQQPATASDDFEVVLFAKDLMIPARDGVKLATDIYRPALNGVPVDRKLPIVLTRTPYNKEASETVRRAQYLARHGYVSVVQDDRGAYKSEGVQSKYSAYAKDGYDVVEWLAKLPYTDGQVGMYGTSYSAHTQAGAAIMNPPHLKTIVPNCGGVSNGWAVKMRHGGAYELGQQITWAYSQLANQTKNPEAAAMLKREKAADWVGVNATKRGVNPLSIAPNFEDYFFEMMTRADYDDYWKTEERNWSLYYEQTADIPMLHVTGWYDSYTSSSIDNYVALSKIKKSPVRLLVGPWLHGRNTSSSSGEVEFGTAAAIADFYEAFHLRWFDHFLKGRDNGVQREPAVKLFVMGGGDGRKDQKGRMNHGGYWKTSETWPVAGTKVTTYYLHGDGTLSTSPSPAADRPTSYPYNPANPVPTIGGSFTGSEVALAGAFDQREREFTSGAPGTPAVGFLGSKAPYLPLKARPDVVVFQTAPLTQDVEVIGPIVVKVFASSTAVDTDFTAKLVDVYPPNADYPSGFEMNVTDGIVRARYRNSPARAELMQPGEIYQFEIAPFPTANLFKKGHRIRVDISSSNFPRFDVNPNTGEALGMSRGQVIAQNTLYHDAQHPSAVLLPVVAAGPSAAK